LILDTDTHVENFTCLKIVCPEGCIMASCTYCVKVGLWCQCYISGMFCCSIGGTW